MDTQAVIDNFVFAVEKRLLTQYWKVEYNTFYHYEISISTAIVIKIWILIRRTNNNNNNNIIIMMMLINNNNTTTTTTTTTTTSNNNNNNDDDKNNRWLISTFLRPVN